MIGHIGLLAHTTSIVGSQKVGAARSSPEIALMSQTGKVVRPLAHLSRPTAFVFALVDCPIANAYAPELQRQIRKYAGRVNFVVVLVDRGLKPTEAASHCRAYGLLCSTVLDPKLLLVDRFGATIVPEACLVDAKGRLAYRGRIDDTYASLGVRRSRTAHRDLQDAIDAVLAHRPVKPPRTTPVGCVIPKRG